MAFIRDGWIYFTAGDWLRFWRVKKNRDAMRRQLAENLSAPNPAWEYLRKKYEQEDHK